MDNASELKALRNEIAGAIREFALTGAGDDNNIDILMAIINAGLASVDVYKKALLIIKQTPQEERNQDQLNVLLDMYFDIGSRLSPESIVEKAVSDDNDQ